HACDTSRSRPRFFATEAFVRSVHPLRPRCLCWHVDCFLGGRPHGGAMMLMRNRPFLVLTGVLGCSAASKSETFSLKLQAPDSHQIMSYYREVRDYGDSPLVPGCVYKYSAVGCSMDNWAASFRDLCDRTNTDILIESTNPPDCNDKLVDREVSCSQTYGSGWR